MKKLLITLVSALILLGNLATNVLAEDSKISEVNLFFNKLSCFETYNDFVPNNLISIPEEDVGKYKVRTQIYFFGENIDMNSSNIINSTRPFESPSSIIWNDEEDDSRLINAKYIQYQFLIYPEKGYCFDETTIFKINNTKLNKINSDSIYKSNGNGLYIGEGSFAGMYACITTLEFPINSNCKEVELTYEVPSSYEWSVPSSTTISTTESSIGNVAVSSCILEDGKKLKITVASTNDWKVKTGNNEIAYSVSKVSKGSSLKNNDVVLETDEAKTQELFAKIPTEGTKAGTYTDTLTFTASVVKSN